MGRKIRYFSAMVYDFDDADAGFEDFSDEEVKALFDKCQDIEDPDIWEVVADIMTRTERAVAECAGRDDEFDIKITFKLLGITQTED